MMIIVIIGCLDSYFRRFHPDFALTTFPKELSKRNVLCLCSRCVSLIMMLHFKAGSGLLNGVISSISTVSIFIIICVDWLFVVLSSIRLYLVCMSILMFLSYCLRL